ncbi:hypothetical protein LOAG_01863 [Loa loa]|uniref:Uncharacterized protein n=1 Tax=Loa loa TaxID=7209 RepID=A0A1S0U8R9_LOALO|nr:hypothetical protein LOAG_01863 [Loa loa]EFO26624.1 hypothetical protein LOAG_01863 [Loa loa]
MKNPKIQQTKPMPKKSIIQNIKFYSFPGFQNVRQTNQFTVVSKISMNVVKFKRNFLKVKILTLFYKDIQWFSHFTEAFLNNSKMKLMAIAEMLGKQLPMKLKWDSCSPSTFADTAVSLDLLMKPQRQIPIFLNVLLALPSRPPNNEKEVFKWKETICVRGYKPGVGREQELVKRPSHIEQSWERHRDDIVVVTIWLIMLSYALASNILILIGEKFILMLDGEKTMFWQLFQGTLLQFSTTALLNVDTMTTVDEPFTLTTVFEFLL